MHIRTYSTLLALSLLLVLAACGADDKPSDTPPVADPVPSPAPTPPPRADAPTAPAGQPEHIKVDHILIGVKPAIPTGETAENARRIAYGLLEKLKAGEDWAVLKKRYTNDPPPGGPYGMANHGVPPAPGERPRTGMVPAFGDVGFTLEVGEIKMADFDKDKSPFGYHIIKRVE